LEERLTVDGDDIEFVDKFPYLGDVLSTEGGVHEAIIARIRSAWKKFRKGISLRIKEALYKCYVRSVLTYGAECWPLRVEDERKLITTEMRMLRMLCGKTLKDKISNEKIHEMMEVEGIEEHLNPFNPVGTYMSQVIASQYQSIVFSLKMHWDGTNRYFTAISRLYIHPPTC